MENPACLNFVLLIKIADIKWKEIHQELINQSNFHDNIYNGNSLKNKNFLGISSWKKYHRILGSQNPIVPGIKL